MSEAVLVRLPASLHLNAALAAKRIDLSQNSFITMSVAVFILQRMPGAAILAQMSVVEGVMMGVSPRKEWKAIKAAISVLQDAEMLLGVEYEGSESVVWAIRFTKPGLRMWRVPMLKNFA